MDCKTAQSLIPFFDAKPEELEGCALEELKAHLEDCPECQALAAEERQLDRTLRQAMHAVPVAPDAKGRLLTRLRQERRARRWRFGWLGGAVAAAALIGIAILALHTRESREEIDLEKVGREFATTQARDLNADTVRDWYKATYNLDPAPPEDFDYRYLVFYDLGNFEGKRVPVLLFVRGNANARVYILSHQDFDFSRVTPGDGYNVQFEREADSPYGYVVACNSASINLFKRQEQIGRSRERERLYQVAQAP